MMFEVILFSLVVLCGLPQAASSPSNAAKKAVILMVSGGVFRFNNKNFHPIRWQIAGNEIAIGQAASAKNGARVTALMEIGFVMAVYRAVAQVKHHQYMLVKVATLKGEARTIVAGLDVVQITVEQRHVAVA